MNNHSFTVKKHSMKKSAKFLRFIACFVMIIGVTLGFAACSSVLGLITCNKHDPEFPSEISSQDSSGDNTSNRIDEDAWRAAFDFGNEYTIKLSYEKNGVEGFISTQVEGGLYCVNDSADYLKYYEKDNNDEHSYYMYTYDEDTGKYVRSAIEKSVYDSENEPELIIRAITQNSSDYTSDDYYGSIICSAENISVDDVNSVAFGWVFDSVDVIIHDNGKAAWVHFTATDKSDPNNTIVGTAEILYVTYDYRKIRRPWGMTEEEWDDVLTLSNKHIELNGAKAAPYDYWYHYDQDDFYADYFLLKSGWYLRYDGDLIEYKGNYSTVYPIYFQETDGTYYKYSYYEYEYENIAKKGYFRTETTEKEYNAVKYGFDFLVGCRDSFEYDFVNDDYHADKIDVCIDGKDLTICDVLVNMSGYNDEIFEITYRIIGEQDPVNGVYEKLSFYHPEEDENLALPDGWRELDTGITAEEWDDVLTLSNKNITVNAIDDYNNKVRWSKVLSGDLISYKDGENDTVFYQKDGETYYGFTTDSWGYVRNEITLEEYNKAKCNNNGKYSLDFLVGLRDKFKYDIDRQYYYADDLTFTLDGTEMSIRQILVTADKNGVTEIRYKESINSIGITWKISYEATVTLPDDWHEPITDTGLTADEWNAAFVLSDINNTITQTISDGESVTNTIFTLYNGIQYASVDGTETYFDGDFIYTCKNGKWFKQRTEEYEYAAILNSFTALVGLRDKFDYNPFTKVYYAESVTVTAHSENITLTEVSITFNENGKLQSLICNDSGTNFNVSVNFEPTALTLPEAEEIVPVDDKNLTAAQWDAMFNLTGENFSYKKDFINDSVVTTNVYFKKNGYTKYSETYTETTGLVKLCSHYNADSGKYTVYTYMEQVGQWLSSGTWDTDPMSDVENAVYTNFGGFAGKRSEFTYDETRGGYFCAETTLESDETVTLNNLLIKVKDGKAYEVSYEGYYTDSDGVDKVEHVRITVEYDIGEIELPTSSI